LDSSRDIRITLLEGAPRILAALPEKMSEAASLLLQERGVVVKASIKVTQVSPVGVTDQEGHHYPARLCVWAAGIEAPAFLKDLGLETNGRNQIVVDRRLCTEDPSIFVMGDCAQAPSDNEGEYLPARAQVA